ncbi:hypothetical protein ACHAO8_011134 [Botrytis cinerea]
MSFLDITLATLQPSDVFKFDRNGLKPVFIEWISTSREWKRLLSSVSSESPLTKNCIKTNIDLESLYPRLRLPLNWKSIKHKEGFEIEEIVKDKVCAKLAREWQDHIDNKRRGTNEKGGEGHVARDPRTRAEKIVSEEELNQALQRPAAQNPVASNQPAQNQTAQSAVVFDSLAEIQPVQNQAVQNPAAWTPASAVPSLSASSPSAPSQSTQSLFAPSQSAQNQAVPAVWAPAPAVPNQSAPSQSAHNQAIQSVAVCAPLAPSQSGAQNQSIQDPVVFGFSKESQPVQNQAPQSPAAWVQSAQNQTAHDQPAQFQPGQTFPIRSIQAYTEHFTQPQTQAQSSPSSHRIQVQTDPTPMPQITQPAQFQSSQTQQPFTQPQDPLYKNQTTQPQWAHSQIPFQYQSNQLIESSTPHTNQIQSASTQIPLPQLESQPQVTLRQNPASQTYDRTITPQGLPPQVYTSLQCQAIGAQATQVQNRQMLSSQSRIASPQYQTQYVAQPVQSQLVQAHTIQPQPIQFHAPLQHQDSPAVHAQSANGEHPQIPFHSQTLQPQMQAQSIQPHTSYQHELPFSQTPTPTSESSKPSTTAFESGVVPPQFFNSNLNTNHHLHPHLQNPPNSFPNHTQNANPQPVQAVFTLDLTEAAKLTLDTIQEIIDAFDRDIEAVNRLD